MEHSMTDGNITKQLVSFSMPVIMGNIFQQLYNTADAMIVGKLIGKEAFAAVSVANPIMSVVLFFLVGLAMGVGILLAQYYGAGDRKLFRTEFSTALIAGVGFTVIASGVCIMLSSLMLKAANTPSEIFESTNQYLKVIFAGMIFSFMYNFLACALRSIGDSKTAFQFLVISTLINVVLDFILVKFTPLGVLGAAIATVVAQIVSSTLCIIHIYRNIPILALGKEDFVFEKKVLKNTIVFSWASAMQQTILYFGRLLIQGTINAHGTDMITGYNAAIRLEAFIMAFIDGTQNSIATFAGQNKGAGKPERLKKGLTRTIQMNMGFIILCDILMLTVPELLIGIYVSHSNTEAIGIGVVYITVMPFFYLFCAMMSAIQGFFRGVGKVKITMFATFFQIFTRCMLAILLVPRYGIYGVCISVIVGWVLMLTFLGIRCLHYMKDLDKILEQR